MSEPTVQDLVESVDALGKTTSVLVERYTEAIFGVEVSAGSAAEDAKKTAADRVQTGLDAEFTALKANEAKDSAAQAEQAKLDAQAVTQLSTFKQYRDQAQQGATTSTAQAVIATQKGTIATEQAAIATSKANVATDKANVSTEQAGIATQKAQAASDSERVVLQKAQQVSDNTTLVATHTATVVRKSDEVVVNAAIVAEDKAVVVQQASEVASNASTVASNTTTTTQKAAEATTAANTSANNAKLSKEWAVGLTPPAGNTAPSNTNNAMYWAQQAQHNANQTFISGGLFTPTTQTPYPNTTGVVRDTIWLVEFAAASTTFTYTTGQLSGKTVKNGDMIFWDTPENKFNLIPTKLGGILSLVTEWGTEEGPSVDIRGRYIRKSGDTATGLITAPGFKLAAGYQGLTSSNSKNVIRTTQANDGVVLGDSANELYLDYLTEIKVRRGSAQTPGRVYTSLDKPSASELDVVGNDWAEANLTKKYVLVLGSAPDYLPRYGKLVSIAKTDASASLLINGGGDFGVATRFSALVVISSRGNQVAVQAVELTSSTDPLGFKLFSRDTGSRFELWVSGGDYNLPIQITQLNSQGTTTLVDWTPETVGSTVPDNLVSVTPAKIYTQYNKPSPSDIGAVAGSSKAGFLPAGPTTSRPTTAEFPANTRALRFNTTTGEWEGLTPAGEVTPIGGGGVPEFIYKTASFTVEKKKAYKLSMVDGVSKTVTVPTLGNGEWFALDVTAWKRGTFGFFVTVDFGNDVLSNGETDFDTFEIDRPCVLYFEKVDGKWTIVDGIGIDGSYDALEKRVDELERYPTSWMKVGGYNAPDAVGLNTTYFEANSGEILWRRDAPDSIQIKGILRLHSSINFDPALSLPAGVTVDGGTQFAPANIQKPVNLADTAVYLFADNNSRTINLGTSRSTATWFMFNATFKIKREGV